MSNLLHTLAHDWHNPHPYWKVIEAVAPTSPYKQKIEDILQHGGWHKDGAPTARMLQKNDANNHWPFLYPPMLG